MMLLIMQRVKKVKKKVIKIGAWLLLISLVYFLPFIASEFFPQYFTLITVITLITAIILIICFFNKLHKYLDSE